MSAALVKPGGHQETAYALARQVVRPFGPALPRKPPAKGDWLMTISQLSHQFLLDSERFQHVPGFQAGHGLVERARDRMRYVAAP
jgi:hypothetical protein